MNHVAHIGTGDRSQQLHLWQGFRCLPYDGTWHGSGQEHQVAWISRRHLVSRIRLFLLTVEAELFRYTVEW